jgi:hypothetical protein
MLTSKKKLLYRQTLCCIMVMKKPKILGTEKRNSKRNKDMTP